MNNQYIGSVSGAINHRSYTLKIILLYCAVIAGAVFLPLLTAVLTMALLVFISRSSIFSASLAIFSITAIFCFINVGKGFDGDWNWYTYHYVLLKDLNFSSYYGRQIGSIPIKLTEPIYYYVSFLTSRMTGGNIPALAVLITALIYIPVGYAIFNMVKKFLTKSYDVAFVVSVVLLTGITFTLTIQLVRQEMASAIFVVGLVLLFYKQYKSGIFIFLMACLTHNSALVPSFFTLVVLLLGKRRLSLGISTYVVVWLFALVLGVAYVYGPGASYYESGRSDGDISQSVLLFDAALLCLTYFVHKNCIINRFDDSITYMSWMLLTLAFVYSGFLLGVSVAPIPFLRMYFYVELFRALMLAIIFSVFLQRQRNLFFYMCCIVAAIGYVYVRMLRAPYFYHFDIVSVFTSTPFVSW